MGAWRKVSNLLTNLPPESATTQALSGVAHETRWTVTDYLLAAVIDTLADANWQRGGCQGPRPKPVPRPGVDGGEQHIRGDVLPPDEYGAELARRYHD